MTSRSYILGANRVPVAVEVDGKPDDAVIADELRRLYGASLRLGRWAHRGRRRRAEVVRGGNGSRCASYAGPGWWVSL